MGHASWCQKGDKVTAQRPQWLEQNHRITESQQSVAFELHLRRSISFAWRAMH